MNKPKEFWISLMQDRVLNQKWVTIYAVPSKKYQQELADEEERRVKGRHEILGQPGLTKLAAELKEAIEANSV